MAGKFFVLQRIADFAPGFFENTAVEEGSIQLGRHTQAEAYVQSGSYTSQPFYSEPFFSMVSSWNADTPPGTSVEMQVRVSADGRWSKWFSLGRWSPYIRRGSAPHDEDGIAAMEEETVSLAPGSPPADVAQLRILLQSEDGSNTPKVHLLAVSTNATQKMGQEPPAYEREFEMPAYSCQNRDPAIGGRMASVTSLTMLMNRWGADLLPEEVARAAYDTTAGHYGNLSFLCAVAGAYGFSSHVSYAGLAPLRREVWKGRAVGARIHYRAPSLAGEEEEETDRLLPPVMEGATRDSKGHMVVVHGFAKRGDTEVVVINDPLAPDDDTVQKEVPLSAFSKMYTGIALFLRRGVAGAGMAGPRRRLAKLTVHDNFLRLYNGDEELVPAKLAEEAFSPCTMCYTLSDGVAYASAAQQKFYYPTPDERGAVRFERALAAGRRMTFYLIGSQGGIWVAETFLDEEPTL